MSTSVIYRAIPGRFAGKVVVVTGAASASGWRAFADSMRKAHGSSLRTVTETRPHPSRLSSVTRPLQ